MTTDREAWKRYGSERRKAEAERTPTFMRVPEPTIRKGAPLRAFSLGDLRPGSIRLASDTSGYDGFSVALACLICFGAGIVTCRLLQAFF